MNTSDYINFVRCQQLMAQPISNKPGENYIVATDDDNLISQYSKRFHNDGYNVEVIDLIDPANSSVSYDVLQQIESAEDAKWFANQLEAPWLQDDPYYQVTAASLIVSFVRILKHTDRSVCISSLMSMMDNLYVGVMRLGRCPEDVERLVLDTISVTPNCDLAKDLEQFTQYPTETLKNICKHSSKILHHHFRYSDSSAVEHLTPFDPRTLFENKTVLFVRVDSNCIERNNCASMIFKCIAKSLYCQIYEMELSTLPIKTNFLCKSPIFQSLCCDILGDSIAPHLGLHMTCPGFHSQDDDLSHIFVRAVN